MTDVQLMNQLADDNDKFRKSLDTDIEAMKYAYDINILLVNNRIANALEDLVKILDNRPQS